MLEEESANKKDFVKDIGNSLKNELKKDPFGKKLQRFKHGIITLITSLKQARNIVKNNYELGRKHYELGNFDDAVLRFKFLTWMEPRHADGWYWLGASYMAVDKKPNAKAALIKAVAIKPDFQEAKDLLQAAVPENFTIRQVTEAEADKLTEIHVECFPRYWNREVFTDFFAVKDTFAFLVEEGQEAIAMLVYRVAFDQAEILTLAVLPAYRKLGIARKLVVDMLEKCKALGVEKLFLEVEVDNNPAIKLYENSGFQHINRRKLYYQQLDGSLTDALVMMKKLS